jgi:hypothetical protein
LNPHLGCDDNSDACNWGNSTFSFRGQTYPLVNDTLSIDDFDKNWMDYAFLGNDQYSLTDMARNLTCQPSHDYTWGFSYLLLFITSVINTIWILIVYFLLKVAHRNSQAFKVGRRFGRLRAAMDLSTAIQADLGQDATFDSEAGLKDRLKHSRNGMGLEEDALQISVTGKSGS